MTDLPDFDALWDYDRAADTEKVFRELLPAAEESSDVDYLARLLTQIARAQGLQGRSDDAMATLDRVQGLLTDRMTEARLRYLLERGRAINGLPRPYREDDEPAREARVWFQQAWDYGRDQSLDFYAVDAAHMLAIASAPEESIVWLERALELAENSSEERAGNWRGSLYNNLGWTYFDLEDYERALDLFTRGLVFRQERKQEAQVRIARWSLAKTQRMLGQTETALSTQRALLAEYEDLGETDAYVFEELAECLLALQEEDAAGPWFARAYESLSTDTWFMENYPERAARMQRLAR